LQRALYLSKFVDNPPDAASLMTTARSFGNYDLASALADLVDNSIDAGADEVGIICDYRGGDPEVRVVDNGKGMSPDELKEAMRPASKDPREKRSPDELGRFGWGLKSASFSQCRKLCVISRKNGHPASGAIWNLDDIANWKMQILTAREAEKASTSGDLSASGTEVIWNGCDRLSEDGELSETEFNSLVSRAIQRISLIFHKYLAKLVPKKRLIITLNGQALTPYDPFCVHNEATQQLEIEPVPFGKHRVSVKPFILPHWSKLSEAEHAALGGEEGWIKNQGFYVYRNHRLIIEGTWFGLVKHGELSQLVRIAVDIPNTLDSVWKISIDKHHAQLPNVLKNRLQQVVESIRSRSAHVVRRKPGSIDREPRAVVWSRHVKNGEISYSINRDHPLLQALRHQVTDDMRQCLDGALTIIEKTFPVDRFGHDASKSQDRMYQAIADPKELASLLTATIPKLLHECGGDLRAFTRTLRAIEPYSQNWPFVETYLRERNWYAE
jgi:hypothetical protein